MESLWLGYELMVLAECTLCSSKIHLLKPSPQCNGICKWKLWDDLVMAVEPSQMGLVPLWRRPQKSPCPLCLVTHAMRTQQKVAFCESEVDPSRTASLGALISDAPALGTERNTVLWFKPLIHKSVISC